VCGLLGSGMAVEAWQDVDEVRTGLAVEAWQDAEWIGEIWTGEVRQFRRGAFWIGVVRKGLVRQVWNLIRSKNEKNSKEINH